MLAPHTEENESGLLLTLKSTHHVPTPTASDHIERKCTSTDRASALNFETNKSVSLDRWVKMWPTPTAHDVTKRGNTEADHHYYPHDLANMVEIFPTSIARDSRSFKGAVPLPNHEGAPSLIQRVGGQLNPTWVEWLMGYPLEWTALEHSATPSSRKLRNSSGGKSLKRKKKLGDL
jgi:hypothetical protein